MSEIMTEQHPISPPAGLVDEWITSLDYPESWGPQHLWIATQAARWGADQELEACVQVMYDRGLPDSAKSLFRVRRPKPPSLKEQALVSLEEALVMWMMNDFNKNKFVSLGTNIRLALEALPDA